LIGEYCSIFLGQTCWSVTGQPGIMKAPEVWDCHMAKGDWRVC